MNNKTLRDTFIIGFALFAVFFGAGNLIFPPSIGLVSGTNWPTALLGFVLTGIVLPLLSVIAVLNSDGKFEVLTNPISPWFYKVFNVLIMVGVGMFVTIPRTAATTHELGIQNLFPQTPPVITILVFFALNFYFAMDKSNFIDKIGKALTPLLLGILLFIVYKGFFDPIGAPAATELGNPFSNAFISAYQTGDLFTGLLCASVFIASITSHGYSDPSSIRKITINSTVIAGIGLLLVYGGLLYLGATGSSLFPKEIESAALVTGLVEKLLGSSGTIILALAVSLACLTTAIGLTVASADFLSNLTSHRVSYRNWVLFYCVVGSILGSLGVENIINFALPLFLALYPVSIVLVFLGLFRKYMPNAGAYKGAAILTIIVSVVETIGIVGEVESFNSLISLLPFSANGFSWVIPSIIGFIFGTFLSPSKTEKLPKAS
ncbi:branched-chain amino acid transport system II carrier protein [Ammoniphilus sp. 3BR4]|uniref:branched-chain amino acid transport system II carrier protein n=1 Tax=Ammoniphilus sp. 3BR4 TaxID=3158265 RepID=UPI0034661063